ncbi:PRC-barrel domain containing protein [Kitasatospora purpeofusca]|uniref:PRC-barrel domain containing protein n=1 Tax=Kitasatospora purpeofusca TaxID=67352 RepID=UPI0036AA8189
MSEGVNLWQFRDTSGHTAGTDLIGFHVEAVDGSVGKVDRLSEAMGSQYMVVDTGPWIFGRLVLLPAGTVIRIEIGEQKVYIDRTKDDIKHSPTLGVDDTDRSPDFQDRYALYYDPFYGGRRF